MPGCRSMGFMPRPSEYASSAGSRRKGLELFPKTVSSEKKAVMASRIAATYGAYGASSLRICRSATSEKRAINKSHSRRDTALPAQKAETVYARERLRDV